MGVVDAGGWGCWEFLVGFGWGLGELGQDCVQVVLEKWPEYVEMYCIVEFEAVQPEYYGQLVVTIDVQSVGAGCIVSMLVLDQLIQF